MIWQPIVQSWFAGPALPAAAAAAALSRGAVDNESVIRMWLSNAPVSPSGVSGISPCRFRNCQSLDKL